MSRSNKSKIAVTLLSALTFGANGASAMNSGIKISGNLATKSSSFSTSKDSKLGSKNERIEKGVSVLKKGLWKKILAGFVITGGAVEAANEAAAGIMWAKDKESDNILKGKYSLTNLIRTKFKKDDKQPDPGDKENKKTSVDDKQDDKNPEKKINEKENEKENEMSAHDQILEKFRQAWNDDNNWGSRLKEACSRMIKYVCDNSDNIDMSNAINVRGEVLDQKAWDFFVSVCKGKNTEFNVKKTTIESRTKDRKTGKNRIWDCFEIKGNDNLLCRIRFIGTYNGDEKKIDMWTFFDSNNLNGALNVRLD